MKPLALYNKYSTRIIAGLAALCALSVFMYGAFLLMAVAHAAELKVIEEELMVLESEASQLQSQYIVKTKALTIEHARALGFVEPVAQTTVAVSDAGLSVVPAALR
jgi:hypothetical protein